MVNLTTDETIPIWRVTYWHVRGKNFTSNAFTILAGVGGILAIKSGIAAKLQPLFGGGW
ncbi:hypothetical protein GCM10010448_49000 [Streptomyces glomeratus]|uniref:Uncharacterized protein n=1 Tax=Streptomyces glomeratus TaxID=284452 RepID=A0ABP6LYS7_9ACTN